MAGYIPDREMSAWKAERKEDRARRERRDVLVDDALTAIMTLMVIVLMIVMLRAFG